MKTLAACLAVLFGTASLPVLAQDAPDKKEKEQEKEKGTEKEKGREVEGWGKGIDPDEDCKFVTKDEMLQIDVPGGKAHDLAADINVTNAPRVVQDVKGDFTIQVCVEGGFTPGGESTQPGRVGYNGAAVIAMADSDNVVTLARGVLQVGNGKPRPYANFEIRSGGKVLRIGSAGDNPLPLDGPIHLRLERRGDKFLGSVSEDGKKWDELQPKDVPAEWPKELKTGVAAISTSIEDFNAQFSKLQVVNAK